MLQQHKRGGGLAKLFPVGLATVTATDGWAAGDGQGRDASKGSATSNRCSGAEEQPHDVYPDSIPMSNKRQMSHHLS